MATCASMLPAPLKLVFEIYDCLTWPWLESAFLPAVCRVPVVCLLAMGPPHAYLYGSCTNTPFCISHLSGPTWTRIPWQQKVYSQLLLNHRKDWLLARCWPKKGFCDRVICRAPTNIPILYYFFIIIIIIILIFRKGWSLESVINNVIVYRDRRRRRKVKENRRRDEKKRLI